MDAISFSCLQNNFFLLIHSSSQRHIIIIPFIMMTRSAARRISSTVIYRPFSQTQLEKRNLNCGMYDIWYFLETPQISR